MTPQFFFTPTNPGPIAWGVGPELWLPTATDTTLAVNRWGGGPVAVAITVQGPWMLGLLASNVWAGSHGSSVTGTRINTLTLEGIIFYNLPDGWCLASLPIITADWTVDSHGRCRSVEASVGHSRSPTSTLTFACRVFIAIAGGRHHERRHVDGAIASPGPVP
jgi:hypothetical protein